MPNHGMVRAVSLHQHLAWLLRTAGTASELQQQLQTLFTRPEVRAMKKAIRRQNSSQRHTGKIHALGQHLRSHQHISLAVGESVQQAPVPISPAGGVAIKSHQAQVTQLGRQPLHHPLRPGPKGLERQ